jgi:hypothetical protein
VRSFIHMFCKNMKYPSSFLYHLASIKILKLQGKLNLVAACCSVLIYLTKLCQLKPNIKSEGYWRSSLP